MAQVLILHNIPRSAPKGAANIYFESDVGVLEEVGFKFDEWIDTVLMQRGLSEHR